MKINIVIADDEELFRVGIAHIISKDESMNVLYQASDGYKLLEYLSTAEPLPDIVITDIKMPGFNGVEATKIIHATYPEIGVIALSTYNSKAFIRNMIDVGASAYLVKNSSPTKVIHTIKQVFNNYFHYDTDVIKALNESRNSESNFSKTVFDKDFLTTREKEVLQLICEQLTTQEIGEKLFISPRTVEVHRKNLLVKTDVKNIAGLVIFAITNELVPPIKID